MPTRDRFDGECGGRSERCDGRGRNGGLRFSAVQIHLRVLVDDACGRLQTKSCVVGVKSAAQSGLGFRVRAVNSYLRR